MLTLPGFGVPQHGGSTPQTAGGSAPVPRNQSGQYTPDATTGPLANAAGKWNVPLGILDGVFGAESNFGADSKTSSAGAVGPFQFIPSTAAQYGYPLTNTPTIAQFQQQADSAAHYLSDLFKQKGSWDAALRAYSGGGYGLFHVQQKSRTPVQANEAQAGGVSLGSLGIGDVFNQAIKDSKYAAVLVGALIVAVVLITHATRGDGPTHRPVPIPV